MVHFAPLALLALAATPSARIAVLLDDPVAGTPASAAIEIELQKRGYEVVAPSVSQKMRKVVAPQELLSNRLPEGLSVFEADAILAGAVNYGSPQDVEGVKSISVSLTVRVVDLGTGQSAATIRSNGVGVGAGGPMLTNRATDQAVSRLFNKRGLAKALKNVGQSAGSVMLVVQGLPNRESLLELKGGLEKALAGAPAREIYFAKGLGKIVLGGSKNKKAMVGPDIADLIAENKTLALSVEEVANTRIVAKYDRARTVRVHALVLEPKLQRRDAKQSGQLGKYLTTQLAGFDFARASYQPAGRSGVIKTKKALERARALGADVVVESEVLSVKGSATFVIRVIDVVSGRPILRRQQVIQTKNGDFQAAQTLVAVLGNELPEKVSSNAPKTKVGPAIAPTAAKELK